MFLRQESRNDRTKVGLWIGRQLRDSLTHNRKKTPVPHPFLPFPARPLSLVYRWKKTKIKQDVTSSRRWITLMWWLCHYSVTQHYDYYHHLLRPATSWWHQTDSAGNVNELKRISCTFILSKWSSSLWCHQGREQYTVFFGPVVGYFCVPALLLLLWKEGGWWWKK